MTINLPVHLKESCVFLVILLPAQRTALLYWRTRIISTKRRNHHDWTSSSDNSVWSPLLSIVVLQAQQCDGQNGWRIPKSNLGSLVFKSHAKKDGLIIYDRPDIARIIPKETKASETGQSKPAKKYTYSEAYHEYDQEPLSHTQVLGANRFPCRFIILTIPRGVFAPRQWKEPITTT